MSTLNKQKLVMSLNGITTISRTLSVEGTAGVKTISFPLARGSVADVMGSMLHVGNGKVLAERYRNLKEVDRRYERQLTGWDAIVAKYRGITVEVERRSGGENAKGRVWGTDYQTSADGKQRKALVLVTKGDSTGKPDTNTQSEATFEQVYFDELKSVRASGNDITRDLLADLLAAELKPMAEVVLEAGADVTEHEVTTREQLPLPQLSYRVVLQRSGEALLKLSASVHNRGGEPIEDAEFVLTSALPYSATTTLDKAIVAKRPEYLSSRTEIQGGEEIPEDEVQTESVSALLCAMDMSRDGGAAPRSLSKGIAGQSAPAAVRQGLNFRYPSENKISIPNDGAENILLINRSVGAYERRLYWSSRIGGIPGHVISFTVPKDCEPLASGPCELFIEDENGLDGAGKAPLPDAYPGSEVKLSYAQELGVSVTPKQNREPSEVILASLSGGTMVTQTVSKRKVVYTVASKVDQDVVFQLDHFWPDHEPAYEVSGLEGVKTTAIEGGIRLTFSLPAGTSVQLNVDTTVVSEATETISTNSVATIQQAFSVTTKGSKNRLGDIAELKEVLPLFGEYEEAQAALQVLQTEKGRMKDRHKLLQQTCIAMANSAGAEAQQTALGKVTSELIDLEDTKIPDAEKAIATKVNQIVEALRKVDFKRKPEKKAA